MNTKVLQVVRSSVLLTVLLMLLCGVAYPALMNLLGGLLFPQQAGGSLIEYNGQIVGSSVVGQPFAQPYYFHGRPSAGSYSTGENRPASGSDNLAPSNPKLVERVTGDVAALLAANPERTAADLPVNLVTQSGSGLDPHISPEAALFQLPAVAAASGIAPDELQQMIVDSTTRPLQGLPGAPAVNVLQLNLLIAARMAA